MDLTDSTSVSRIDLVGKGFGGKTWAEGGGSWSLVSQTERWRIVSDMQSHNQGPWRGGIGRGHPSLCITLSHKDIKLEG